MENYSDQFLKIAHLEHLEWYGQLNPNTQKHFGCFYCLEVFEVVDFVESKKKLDELSHNALCPSCGIDSLLTDKWPIKTEGFLIAMQRTFFSSSFRNEATKKGSNQK